MNKTTRINQTRLELILFDIISIIKTNNEHRKYLKQKIYYNIIKFILKRKFRDKVYKNKLIINYLNL